MPGPIEQLGSAVAALEIEGIPQLRSALAALDYGVQRRVIRRAARAAIRPVVNAAKAQARQFGRGKETRAEKRARREAGRYRLWETIRSSGTAFPGTYLMTAGPKYGPRFQHKGDIGHLIERGHEKVLWGKRTGGRVEGRYFLKKAWDSQVDVVQGVLRAKVAEGVEAEARRARSMSWLGMALG